MNEITERPDASADQVAMTIRGIQSTRGLLIQALAGTDKLTLQFPDDAPVDLSFVQLVEAARSAAQRDGKSLSLAKPAGANIRRVLERGGFLTGAPDAARFWLHQEG